MLFNDGSGYTFVVRWGRTSQAESSAWDVMLWDTGKWDGSSAIAWTEVQNQTLTVDSKMGKDAFNKRFRTGTCKIVLDNDDGRFSGQDSGMSPGDFVEVFAVITPSASDLPKPIPDATTWQDVTGSTWTSSGALILDDEFVPIIFKWLFSGRVNSKLESTVRGVATVRCTDRFADYATLDFDAGASVGAGENTRDRLNRILANAGLPTINASTPQHTMQATDLAKPTLTEMYLTSESEGGDIWVDQEGLLNVGYRDWLTTGTRQTTVTAVLGGLVGVGITSGEPSQDLQLVVNDATIANAGGTEQTVIDANSIARYGRRTFRRNDLLGDTDTQSQFLAARIAAQLSTVRPRIRNVMVQIDQGQVTSQFQDAALDFASYLLAGDLVMVTIDSIYGHSETFLVHVIGFTHLLFDDQWTIGLTLDDAFVSVGEGGGFDNTAFSTGFDDARRRVSRCGRWRYRYRRETERYAAQGCEPFLQLFAEGQSVAFAARWCSVLSRASR